MMMLGTMASRRDLERHWADALRRADALLSAAGPGAHAIVDKRTDERRSQRNVPGALDRVAATEPRARVVPTSLHDVAARTFRERFGREWGDVETTPLVRAVERAPRRDGWRRALVEHLDRWGLRFRVWREVEEHEWRGDGADAKLVPTGRRHRARVPQPTAAPMLAGSVIHRRGQPPVQILGPADVMLAPLDLALIGVLLGKVRAMKGVSHARVIKGETTTMHRAQERYGKRGITFEEERRGRPITPRQKPPLGVRRGPVRGRRYV